MAENIETYTVLQLLKSFEDLFPWRSKSEVLTKDKGIIHATLNLLRGSCFQSVIGYFANHRQSSPYARIDDEYKVQDLLFCILRTILDDLQYEDPRSKTQGAITFTRVDFVSRKSKILIEAKFSSSKHDAKKIEREISEDLVKYGKSPDFDSLIFFIYCYNYAFPNSREFENGFTNRQKLSNHEFNSYCIIKP